MSDHKAYRAFRQDFLKEAEKNLYRRGRSNWPNEEDGEHFFSTRRRLIQSFRACVAEGVEALLSDRPEMACLVRRALRIPAPQSLVPTRLHIAAQWAMFFWPDPLLLHQARRLLQRVGTFEGRRYVFEKFLKTSFPSRLGYYSDTLDFALVRFDLAKSNAELEGLGHLDLDELKALHGLKVRALAEANALLPPASGRPVASVLKVLVDEGAVSQSSELSWLRTDERHLYRYPYRNSPSLSELNTIRWVVRSLLAYGVSRRLVAEAHVTLNGYLPTDHLAQNLALLKDRGVVDISDVFDQVGAPLWRTPTSVWQFVLDEVGARHAADIALFKPILESHKTVSAAVVRALFALGADLKCLSHCTSLLNELARADNDPDAQVDGLRRLAASPHHLSVEHLAACKIYLGEKRDLASFLAVLIKHGFASPPCVLAFQLCYPTVSAQSLDQWLTLADAHVIGEPAELVASWVQRANMGSHADALEYLLQAMDIAGLTALQQALKLVPLGVPMLQYLVEDKGLKRWKAMREWYHHEASGLQGYRSWRAFDALDKVLLNDAYVRRQFNRLQVNQQYIQDGVQARIQHQIGPWPYKASEEEKEIYRLASNAAQGPERQALLPWLSVILQRTGGVLLPSLLEAAYQGSQALEDRLAQLAPLLIALFEGHGPTGNTLTLSEAEAVALAYRTSVQTVTSTWSAVVGHQDDIATLKRPSYFPMAWRQAQWQLRKPLDRKGFATLVKAADLAQRFVLGTSLSMSDACQNLSPKRLLPSTELDAQAMHLGVLLAVTRGDEVVSQWIRQGFADLMCMDEDSVTAHQRMVELVALFDVVLPDALNARLDRYVTQLKDVDAHYLAVRLSPVSATAQGDGQRLLKESMRQASEAVLRRFLAWAHRQRRKFELASQHDLKVTALRAMLSKHPAAFFAKAGVNLCTAANVEMWREQRQSHLLVFDPAGRRLVGMALVYVETVSALAAGQDSLIIRAINPTDEMLAEHTADSIVESFLDVAVAIAQANKLACVAFPAPMGMHFVSNRDVIESYIKARYIKRADASGWARPRTLASEKMGDASTSLRSRPQRVHMAFDAYERGSGECSDALFVIWRHGEQGEGACLQERLAAA